MRYCFAFIITAYSVSCGFQQSTPPLQTALRQPEAVSLFGKPLHPISFSAETMAALDSNLASAKADYDLDPGKAENIIWLGRRLAYLWRYRDAIEVFSKGIALFPNDARFYRHRGHRYITVRNSDKAIQDLRKAAGLIRGKPDEIEPDGQPNKFNIPTSTSHSNIWYHLGLAYYLKGDFENALIVAGGLGVAPFPLLSDWLQRGEKNIESFIGARSAYQLYRMHLKNLHVATDDGSAGFQGTVVQLLEHYLNSHTVSKPKIFGCGPTKMMKALSELARNRKIDCELSLEGDMACGIGLCQGCPVETVGRAKKYALVCRDGPAFNSYDIVLA